MGDPTTATMSIFTVFPAVAGARTEVAGTEDAAAVADAEPVVVPIPADFAAHAAAVAGAGAEAMAGFLGALATHCTR